MRVESQPPPLHVSALSAPSFVCGDVNITHQLSRTAQLLLVYLLTTNQEQLREGLAELFWPEREPRLAASNLRTVLTELRKSCADYLRITRNTVTINAALIVYDVANFRAQMAAAKAALAQNALATAVTHWEAALRLHQAPFLMTMREPESSELQLWLALERELLFKQMLGALRQIVGYYAGQGNSNAALPLAHRWLALEPLDEDALQQVMDLHAQRGEPEAALAHYQRFRHLYRQEHGVTPDNPALDLLATTMIEAVSRPPAIQATPTTADRQPAPAQPAPMTPRFSPPAPLVNLYGREEQIRHIGALLRSPTTRLVSLVGMGGVGKSLLAQAVGVQMAAALAAGVCFVPLADVRAVGDADDASGRQQQVALTIAAALVVKPADEATVSHTLQNYLRDLELLLILDNCEHVVDALGLVNDLLRAAPRLRILATTRVRLNLLAEIVEPVPSLPLPQELSLEGLMTNPCIQLFIERAQRVFPSFVLDRTNAPALQQICQTVGGLPLALELAAHWTPLFTPAEIAATLANELDLLTTAYSDVPERQHSIATVLTHSWQLLPQPAQNALAALTIFQNSFSRAAALTVAACSLPTLVTLVNHALVEVREAGVYALHPLVKSFAAGRRADDAVETRYITYFLTEWLPTMGVDQAGVPQAVPTDLPTRQQADLAGAWTLAVERRWYAQLAGTLPYFSYFWQRIGRPREALRLLQHVQDALPALPTSASTWQALQARILYQTMRITHTSLADFAAACQAGEQAYALLLTVGTPVEVGYTLLELARIYLQLERASDALGALEQARPIAEDAHDHRLQIGIGATLARFYWAQGQWEAAAVACQRAAALLAHFPEPPVEAVDLWWEIFNQALLRRDLTVAESTFQRLTAWGERHGLTGDQQLQWQQLHLLLCLAQERWIDAYRPAYALRTVALELGSRYDYCDALCALALIALYAEGPGAAMPYAETALAVATEDNLTLDLPMIHSAMGSILSALGRRQEAHQHFEAMLDYALTRQGEVHGLRHLLGGIFGLASLYREELAPDLFTEAIALVAAQPQAGTITRTNALRMAAAAGIDLTAAQARARRPIDWAMLERFVAALRYATKL